MGERGRGAVNSRTLVLYVEILLNALALRKYVTLANLVSTGMFNWTE